MEELRSVPYRDQRITYILRRKSVKNVNLRIARDGSVAVSASPRVPLSFIDSFVQERAGFILKSREELLRKADFALLPEEYETGDILHILGFAVPLDVREGSPESVQLLPDDPAPERSGEGSEKGRKACGEGREVSEKRREAVREGREASEKRGKPLGEGRGAFGRDPEGPRKAWAGSGKSAAASKRGISDGAALNLQDQSLVLTLRNPAHVQKKRHMVQEWLEGLVRVLFPRLIEEGYRAYAPYGVPHPELRIKSMTSRWGSCLPKRGIITLNFQLIHYPLPAIEYVVWHEYAHFIEANHSRAFYAVLERQMPDWRVRKAMLKQ